MRIRLEEVKELEKVFEKAHEEIVNNCRKIGTSEEHIEEHASTYAYFDYIKNHPHLLVVMGFDEYVALESKRFRNRPGFAGLCSAGNFYRKPSGKWFCFHGNAVSSESDSGFHFWDKEMHLKVEEEHRAGIYDDCGGRIPTLKIGFDELVSSLYEVVDKSTDNDMTLWSPSLWTPKEQAMQAGILHHSTKHILAALKTNKVELADLSWKQLEELVAEVLRAQGLEIHMVRESPQGGRDIIVRGELIPGEEPLTMAVEVKHKRVVDRPQVQAAIYQNRGFPALMFVTSGRFTAGVLREKALAENKLRLFLKDGDALGDLIRNYGLER